MSDNVNKGFDINKPPEKIDLNISEDEIWTYQIEGLAPPHINKPYKYYTLKKFIFAIVIIVAVSLSCYFSIRTVQSAPFEYAAAEADGFQFSKFSNTGYITEVDIDYVSELVYDDNNPDVNTNFKIIKDTSKPVTEIRQYAFNCDEKVKVINISKDVLKIDGKAFYSCWALERIEVDEDNPNYCDVDGVLYTKDMKMLITYPCNHDAYLLQKYGHQDKVDKIIDINGNKLWSIPDEKTDKKVDILDKNGKWILPENEALFNEFEKDAMTYVVPSTVETIGELAFNYANMVTVYLPEGLTRIETLGFFEIPLLKNIYSYKSDTVTDTHFTDNAALGEVYLSLPDGLEYIGSDAFSYNQEMTYVYIPASVTHIGHHAFWDTCYEDKDLDALVGITVINVEMNESDFSEIYRGNSWRPQYDFLLFKKSIDVNYSAQREALK